MVTTLMVLVGLFIECSTVSSYLLVVGLIPHTRKVQYNPLRQVHAPAFGARSTNVRMRYLPPTGLEDAGIVVPRCT
jgi:hypothetical protein